MERKIFNILTICLISCNSTNSRLHYSCDIDDLVPWSDNITLKQLPGHTGNYVSLADTTFPYCIGFTKKISELTDGRILRVEFSAWIKFTKETEGKFVCVIDSLPGQHCIYLDDKIRYKMSDMGKWQKLSAEFYLPKNLKPEYRVRLFIWNLNQGEIWADDIEIKFNEY